MLVRWVELVVGPTGLLCGWYAGGWVCVEVGTGSAYTYMFEVIMFGTFNCAVSTSSMYIHVL